MRALSATLAVAGAGCPAPPTPKPHAAHAIRLVIVGDEPRDVYLQGARAWAELGLEVGFAGPGPMAECPRKWRDSPPCQITVGIVRDPNVRRDLGSNAATDRELRRIRIDASVTNKIDLLIAVAHEVGHVVLDTAEHTAGGVMGGADFVLHDVDRALACEAIGACSR